MGMQEENAGVWEAMSIMAKQITLFTIMGSFDHHRLERELNGGIGADIDFLRKPPRQDQKRHSRRHALDLVLAPVVCHGQGPAIVPQSADNILPSNENNFELCTGSLFSSTTLPEMLPLS
jgi:hypothetical protein